MNAEQGSMAGSSYFRNILQDVLIDSANVMKRTAHGTQRPRPINR